MPDMWTHLIAGDRIAGAIADRDWTAVIHDHRPVFDFGCQGPDFLLYYNFWPWGKDKRGHDLGDAIHDQRCGEFFAQVFSYLSSLTGSRHYEPCLAYGLGLLCHWVLDRTAHPYIHYIAGLYRAGNPDLAHLAGNHKRIEAIIDTILVKEYWGIATDQVPANQRFDLGQALPTFIADLYGHVVVTVYPDLWRQQAPGFLEKSYRDMMSACRVLFDPTGIKRQAVSRLGRLVGNRQNLTYYFYPRQTNRSVDYLNDQHRPWCHPADRDEISHASFRDLLDRAVVEGAAMVDATIAYLTGGLSHEAWRQAIGNLSFSTGKDCDLPVELKYTQPIVE